MTQSVQLEPVQKVFESPELLAKILGFLDNGEARDLVTSLQVSRAFFHGAATTLCRRIEVPQFEYSSTKSRDEILYAKPCSSCYGDEPIHYKKPKGVTAHRSIEAGKSRRYTKRIHPTYRLIYPATRFMRDLYSHVHVVTIEEHEGCDQLAITHPLPLVRTVIARGGHKEVCTTSEPGHLCGFLPTTHPFRLVLDRLCGGMLCKDCTSFRLLSPMVETLVLRMRYSLDRFYCKVMKLPKGFNPARLVFLFPPETSKPLLNSREVTTNQDHLWALGPGDVHPDKKVDGGQWRSKRDAIRSNTFYRLAQLCLAVGNDCKINIVGADHGALHMRGLEAYDDELEVFEPLFPRPKGPRDISSYENNWAFPNKPKAIVPNEEKVLDEYDIPPASFPYACYNQQGNLISATRPRGPIPSTHRAEAARVVEKRVAIMERILHRWIDYILDSRLPLAHWEDEKSNFQDRAAFERHLSKLNDEKSTRDQENWHESHECGYQCREYETDIPESEQGENTVEDQDAFEDREEDDDERDWSAERYLPDEEMSERERFEEERRKEEETEGFKRKVVWEESPLVKSEGGEKVIAFAKTREEIEYKRVMKHKNISFITTHAYHLMEGNKDEMDDPGRYL